MCTADNEMPEIPKYVRVLFFLCSQTFAFDHCFWTMDPNNPKYASQDIVFDALGTDILDNAFEGYNACIFAYGQTGVCVCVVCVCV